MYPTFSVVGRKFRLQGEVYAYEIITSGNINATYKVAYKEENGRLKSYLFQRANTHVFKKLIGIMKNIKHVTNYIRAKYFDQKYYIIIMPKMA